MNAFDLAVIIPASNEEKYISRCLDALVNQKSAPKMLVVVYCNACTDDTFLVARAFEREFTSAGHRLECREIREGGKLLALNRAEKLVETELSQSLSKVYLDADVICSPTLIHETYVALSRLDPIYVTGKMRVMRAKSLFTSAYSGFWQQLPFFADGASGAGYFAVNANGRARWGAFPDIISDDTFVRLHFAPHERVEVSARYEWPMAEGFWNLVKVRRRQNAGVKEVSELYPELTENDGRQSLSRIALAALCISRPLGFIVYLAVHLLSQNASTNTEWTRIR